MEERLPIRERVRGDAPILMSARGLIMEAGEGATGGEFVALTGERPDTMDFPKRARRFCF
jgi:hypothetical protein